MIGGKLYDFDLSGVTKDRWGQTMNPYMKGLDAVLAQKLQADQEQAYQQGLASLSSPKLDAEDIEVITALQGGQTPEGLASLTTPQVSQAQGGLAGLSAPQRRNFEITPEMQQRAVAIDYLTGAQPGTSMNQMIGRYKDLVAAADEKAIGDFERERAYQDTRADKERAYAAQERKEQRDIEKQRMEYIDKRLEALQGPAFRATTETAKANVANEARNLDPERFAGKSDEEILERLRLGVDPQKKTGKDYDKEAELEALKHQFRMEENAQKIANKPTKSDEGLDYATKQEITQEARGIREEKTNLTKEKKSIDTAQIDYDKKMSKLNGFKSQIDQIKKDIKSASTQLGYSSWFAPIAGEKASKSLANLKNIAADLNAAMTELVRASGATATMMNSDVEGKRYLGILANTDWGRKENEDVVKEALLGTIQRYEKGINLYKQELTERRKNLKDDKQNLAQREADYKQYKTGKKQPVKTVSGFEIEIEEE